MTARLSNGSIYLLAVGTYRGQQIRIQTAYNRAEKWLRWIPPGVEQKDVLRDAGRQETISLSPSGLPSSPSFSPSPTTSWSFFFPLFGDGSNGGGNDDGGGGCTILRSLFLVEKIVFISTVVRMDGVPVIYVPAQTHLIYSTKHNSLTLFRGKVLVYLGYASKSREFHAWHARMSNLPRARFLPYFTFCLSSDSCVPFDTDFVSGTFDLVNRSDLTSDTFFFLSHDIFVKVCAALRKI